MLEPTAVSENEISIGAEVTWLTKNIAVFWKVRSTVVFVDHFTCTIIDVVP